MNKIIQNGIYQHFKGNKYQVIGQAHHTETLEEMVIYQSLDAKKELWVRPLKMFQEKVKVNDHLVPRFKFLSTKSSNSAI